MLTGEEIDNDQIILITLGDAEKENDRQSTPKTK